MENATKALLIAAGVLFTLAMVSVFIYFFSQLKQFPEQQEEAIRLEQINKFNLEYESYNKQKMYGTDVITVINKVIDNNLKYGEYLDKGYVYGDSKANSYIDVVVSLKSDIESIATRYYPSTDADDGYIVIPANVKANKVTGWPNGKKSGSAKTNYTLGVIFSKSSKITLLKKVGTKYEMRANVMDFFKNNFESVRIQEDPNVPFDEFHYTSVNSGFTTFKRKIFKCTGMEYNKDTSKVSKIEFAEI